VTAYKRPLISTFNSLCYFTVLLLVVSTDSSCRSASVCASRLWLRVQSRLASTGVLIKGPNLGNEVLPPLLADPELAVTFFLLLEEHVHCCIGKSSLHPHAMSRQYLDDICVIVAAVAPAASPFASGVGRGLLCDHGSVGGWAVLQGARVLPCTPGVH